MMSDSTVEKMSSHNAMNEPGTLTKKKKEKENRNNLTNDFVVDFKQKDSEVIVSCVTGSSNDHKSATVKVINDNISIMLGDGRRFSTKLFAPVLEDNIDVQQKGGKLFITLIKYDPSICWTSLSPMKSPPSHQQNKNHNNNMKSLQQNSVNNNNNCNSNPNCSKQKKLPLGVREHATTAVPCSNKKLLEDMENKDISQRMTKAVENEDSKKETVEVTDVKIDHSETQADNMLRIYLYIKKINKDNIHVLFNTRSIDIKFYTSDAKFLQQHQEATETTEFHFRLPLFGDIIPEQSSFAVTASNIEIKVKKFRPTPWQAVSPVTKSAKPTWKSAMISNASIGTNSAPPAPPAPPAPASGIQARKPTCLVSPSTSNRIDRSFGSTLTMYSDNTPLGYMGLNNIGNTCFMNSVLQCLLNTRELRDYFLSDANYAQHELNTENPLGLGGKLALAFAVLVREAWTKHHKSFSPSKIKSVMSLKAMQFSGFAQHDAQEFMVELLDGLHEDLNRVKKKPYCAEPQELDGWEDVAAANESWRLHKLRNDSIIDDIFKGQFRSTLRCHECNKISVKFDEFCCLSVPIPKDKKKIQVYFFYRNVSRKPLRVVVNVAADAVLEELLEELGRRVKVSPKSIVVIEVFKNRIYKAFARGSLLESVSSSNILYAFEIVTPEQVGGEEVVQVFVTQRLAEPSRPVKCAMCNSPSSEVRIMRCKKCLSVGYCSTECQNSHFQEHANHCRLSSEAIGAPFIVSMPKSHTTYNNLARAMESYARHSVNLFQPPVVHQQAGHRTVVRTKGDSKTKSSYSQKCLNSSGESDTEQPIRNNKLSMNRCRTRGSCSSNDSDCEELLHDNNADDRMEVENCDSSGFEAEDEYNNSSSECQTVMDEEWGKGYVLNQKQRAGGNVCAVSPLLPYSNAATKLFTIHPVSNRGQTICDQKPIEDLGDEPLLHDDCLYLAMDWKTNGPTNSGNVTCLVTNKELDYDDEDNNTEVFATSSSSYRQHGRQPTTLKACMELFTKPESLSEGDSWRCPRCKKPVEATKQMSLWKLPPVLIVQLKRFSFKYVIYSDKIDKFVHYPVNGFDVGSFIASGGGDGNSTIYDLYGVVNHMGRLLGGHYTACARLFKQNDTSSAEIDWRLFDDSHVNNAAEDRIVNDQAYLLLYRRRNDMFTLPPSPIQSNAADNVIPMETQPSASAGHEVTTEVSSFLPSIFDNSSNFITRPTTVEPLVSGQFRLPVTSDCSVIQVNGSVPKSNLTSTVFSSSSSISSSFASNSANSITQLANLNEVHNSTLSKTALQLNFSGKAYDSSTFNSSSGLHNPTSTINTNSSDCGNLVSNIEVEDDCSVIASDGYPQQLSFDGNNYGDRIESSSLSSGDCLAVKVFVPDTDSTGRSCAADSTGTDLAVSSTIVSSRPLSSCFYVKAAPAPYSTSSCVTTMNTSPTTSVQKVCPEQFESSSVDCTPTESAYIAGIALDESTPMSVSSISQPSLSSTEEESISTAQEELD